MPTLENDVYPDVEWIFGYGSLMWRPGFSFVEQHPAKLEGYHRAACIYSHHHRGTPERPGLVLGLDNGGHCEGIAFRINIEDRSQIIEYLHERELIGYAYKPITVDVYVTGCSVRAYTFVADPTHRQYAGDLGIARAAEIIMQAQGASGLNRDYLMNTVEKLIAVNVAEPELLDLLARVRLLTGEVERGGGI